MIPRSRSSREHYQQKPDKAYEDLIKAARTCGVPIPMMRIGVVAADANGVETGRYEGWSRTYIRNFYNVLFGLVANAPTPAANYNDGYLPIKDTAGTISPPTFATQNAGLMYAFSMVDVAVVGETLYGIVIGNGTIPESINSFKLASQFAQGTGAGQISHAAQNQTVVAWNNATRQFTATMVRIFNNNSGSSLVVSETGMQARFRWNNSGNVTQWLLCRDLLPASVTVLNAGQLTVTYTVVMAYPADIVNNPPFPGSTFQELIPHQSWWAKDDLSAAHPSQPRVQRFKRGL